MENKSLGLPGIRSLGRELLSQMCETVWGKCYVKRLYLFVFYKEEVKKQKKEVNL